MRDLPIIFPISLAGLLAMIFFSGAYAISEGATSQESQASTTSVAPSGTFNHPNPPTEGTERFDWYQDVAIWVCPLHSCCVSNDSNVQDGSFALANGTTATASISIRYSGLTKRLTSTSVLAG